MIALMMHFFCPCRAKHPVKVHVWAGILRRGRTAICIFEGVMDRFLFTEILERTLLPFVQDRFADFHRFMQDNDPKHTSNYAKEFINNHNINWWKTPAESLDLNPIENLWHELKEFYRIEVKPKTKHELISGILQFWETTLSLFVHCCPPFFDLFFRILLTDAFSALFHFSSNATLLVQ